MEYTGAKIALICGTNVLTILRDDKPGIPFPNQWDFAGGGREGTETASECALRELHEEFGLNLAEDCLLWRRHYDILRDRPRRIYFFAAKLTHDQIAGIRFGDEGQEWRMMPIVEFLNRADAISHLKSELRLCLGSDIGEQHFSEAAVCC